MAETGQTPPTDPTSEYTLFGGDKLDFLTIEQLAARVTLQRAASIQARNRAKVVSNDNALMLPFEQTEVTADVAETVSLDVAEAVVATAGLLAEAHPNKRKDLKGGAFGGALRRWIDKANPEEKLQATAQNHIALLTARNISSELFSTTGDQEYNGVLFTPEEYSAITLSAHAVSKRVGNLVLKGTTERSPTERELRKKEVINKDLHSRHSRVQEVVGKLHSDWEVLGNLQKAMKAPGYSHHTQVEMDAMMTQAAGVFMSMVNVITLNHESPAESVYSLARAMEYKLGSKDYKKTFTTWKEMADVGRRWTQAKLQLLADIEQNVQAELARRA